jgi:hypothetical protein
MKISGSQPLQWDEPLRRTGRIVSDLDGRLSPRLNNSWLLSLHSSLYPLSLLPFCPSPLLSPPSSFLASHFSVAPVSFRSSRISLSPSLSFSPLTPLSPYLPSSRLF